VLFVSHDAIELTADLPGDIHHAQRNSRFVLCVGSGLLTSDISTFLAASAIFFVGIAAIVVCLSVLGTIFFACGSLSR
jgi:hypothetical protein